MSASLLRARDLRALMDAVYRLHQPVEVDAFPEHLFGILAELLPDTLPSFDFVHLTTGKVETHVTPEVASKAAVADVEAAIREFLWQNPAVPYIIKVSPTAVVQPTDLMTSQQLRNTDFYNHCFRPLEVEHQIAAGILWPGYVGGFAINGPKGRAFTAREVELVRCLRPHVERAFANTLRFAGLRDALEKNVAVLPAVSGVGGSAASKLTEREAEVLHWLGTGKRNAEIATILGVSTRTVHKHVEHVFAKLGVETRTAAAVHAQKV